LEGFGLSVQRFEWKTKTRIAAEQAQQRHAHAISNVDHRRFL